MTAHELARKLLDGPDLPVETKTWMDGDFAEVDIVEVRDDTGSGKEVVVLT